MKTILLVLLNLSFYFSCHAQLGGIVVEATAINQLVGAEDLNGFTSYRIFAQMDDVNYEILSVSGTSECDLNIASSTSFFKSPAAGSSVTGDGLNEALFGIFPEIWFSSYVTIGSSSSGSLGIPLEEDTTDGASDGNIYSDNINQAITIGDGLDDFANQGGDIMFNSFNGGAWFTLSGGSNSIGVGVNNSVLLGQFTTDGDFSYRINVGAQSFGDNFEYNHCDSDVPGLTYASNSCTTVSACNFNPDALVDDGSCIYPGDSCNDSNSQTINDVYTSGCNCEGELTGCMNVIACNFEPMAVVEDGSCELPGDSCNDSNSQTINDVYTSGCSCEGELTGCMNVIACNFEPMAVVEDGSCELPGDSCNDNNNQTINDTYTSACDCEGELTGCVNVVACNFEPMAIVDDGSCLVIGSSCEEGGEIDSNCNCSYNLMGFVILDNNFNGLPDESVYIPFQTVTLEPLGLQIITDDFGFFNFGLLEPGEYTLSVNYASEWTGYTTPLSYTINAPLAGSTPYYFGVSSEDIPDPSGCVDFYQWGTGVPCNDQLGYNICYRNMSPYPINGVIEIELDPLLSYNYSSPPAENIDGQVISWSFEDLGSWEMYFDDIIVDTPSELNIGEFMTSTAKMYAEVEGELVLLFTKVITQEVTCAYDPNDITGIPEGYTDDHLVLPDTRMEYLIRFQNTGNAPAGTVMVVDSLDEDMDISTFQLVANSHSVMTTIDENGRVEFLFEDINLPDSIADEPGSHGMISFKIDFKDDIEIGEEVNQTGYIYFDNNPPVITNTTWHTAHECGGESTFELSATEICVDEEAIMTSINPLVVDYQWNIESTPASTVSEYSQVFTEEGEYIIQLIAENPLCDESSMQMLNVYELPESEITETGALLTASEGASYQWYLNGEELEGATEQTLEAMADGMYSVEVTNENDCSTTSEETMIVSVSELRGQKINLYPNPMFTSSTLEFGNGEKKTVTLLDLQGRIIREWVDIADESIKIDRKELTAGNYLIKIQLTGFQKSISLVVK